MTTRGVYTLAEILSQPSIWQDTMEVIAGYQDDLNSLWRDHPVQQVLFSGCGSTYYLSHTAAAKFQTYTGISARSHPGSEMVLFPKLICSGKPGTSLLVTISRSGKTSETLEAATVFRRHTGGNVISITCDSQSPLALQSDLALAVDVAQEQSVAQTRSFTTMLLMAQSLVGFYTNQDVIGALSDLPGQAQKLMDGYQMTARRLGEDSTIERFFFLGNSFLYGLASEAMLKMKEMSLSHSEVYHTLEFRHGPMSMVNEKTLVVGLISESAYTHEIAVLRQMQQLGARVLIITPVIAPGIRDWAEVVELDPSVPAWARSVLYLPVLQLMAYYRAISKNLDPDRPTNLDAVVHLDDFVSDRA
jgi:glucosamine--fructose-6-phosphate aminotransferase (isomerizing)